METKFNFAPRFKLENLDPFAVKVNVITPNGSTIFGNLSKAMEKFYFGPSRSCMAEEIDGSYGIRIELYTDSNWAYIKVKEVTEDRFYYINDVMPPLYISHVDGEKVKRGVALTEAMSHSANAVVLLVVYQDESGKYYEGVAEIYKADGKPVWDASRHEMTRDNVAKLVLRPS